MALGQIGKPNLGLLETLQQLNELIDDLRGDNFTDHIEELKKKTDEFNASKAAADPAVLNLSVATQENNKSIIEVKQAIATLEGSKLELDRKLNNIGIEQKKVEQSRKDIEKRIFEADAELEQKAKALVLRENKVSERHKAAEALISEYTVKLANLKKITG